jgi:putative DNA primase/helicase
MKTDPAKIDELSAAVASMKPNRIAKAIQEAREEPLSTDEAGTMLYAFNNQFWKRIDQTELSKEITNLFMMEGIDFEPRHVKSVIQLLLWTSPKLSDNTGGKLFLKNGVLDTKSLTLEPHNEYFGNTATLDFEYVETNDPELLWDRCPSFKAWLDNLSCQEQPTESILAALYMVLFNRYDWQLFIEVTGQPNTGKSIFSQICRNLVGAGDWASGDISNLEDPRERALIAGKRLVILPDLEQYRGSARGLCKITGNDAVSINPKYQPQFSQTIRAVILITNNLPMIINDITGAVDRRRVVIKCDKPIRKEDVDVNYFSTIKEELRYVTKLLAIIFPDPEMARRLLINQRDSNIAFQQTYKNDSFWQFCSCLEVLDSAIGMHIGQDRTPSNSSPDWNPEKFLYHAYTDFLFSQSHGQKDKVGITTFSVYLEKYLGMMNKRFIKKRVSSGNITNLLFDKERQLDLQ